MLPRRCIAIALSTAAAAAGAGSVADASGAARFAAPHRSAKTAGTAPCTDPAAPCTVGTALGQAVPGDEVVLAAGEYWKPTLLPVPGGRPGPFDDTLAVPAGVTMRGTDPADLPVLRVEPDAQAEAGVAVGQGGTIRDVAIEGSAAADVPIVYSLAAGISAVAERVRVRTTGSPGALQVACSLSDRSVLRSAVCLGQAGSGGEKVQAVSASSATATFSIRNVTAITTAPGSLGLNFGTGSGTASVAISNSILRGTAADLSVRAGVAGGQAVANVDHSNWVTQSVTAAAGATATLAGLGGNQNAGTAATPVFVDATAGDLRPAPGSPTIDAGVVDAGNNGTLALGGLNRWIGTTTDLGAFEFDPAGVPAPMPTPVPSTPEPVAPAPPALPPSSPAGAAQPSGQATPTPMALADTLAPRLTGFSLGRSVTRATGTTIRFALTEPARVALTFSQPSTGRSAGGRCRARTTSNRTRPRCTIPNVRGALTTAGRAGANAVRFRGSVGGKRLAPGRYTVAASPTDAAGNRGAAATRTFTLKR